MWTKATKQVHGSVYYIILKLDHYDKQTNFINDFNQEIIYIHQTFDRLLPTHKKIRLSFTGSYC